MPFPKGYNPWEHRKKKQQPEKEEEPEILVAETTVSMSITQVPPKMTVTDARSMYQAIQQMRNTFNRHSIGMEKAIEDMVDATARPKCVKCYVIRGWLTNCECNKEVK